MSAEEDGPFGVEVAYVETESEDNNESEATIPAVEVAAVHEDTPATVRNVNATIILDDTTPDQSSSSSSSNTCCGVSELDLSTRATYRLFVCTLFLASSPLLCYFLFSF